MILQETPLARIHLLIIDPQNDFCDLPATWCPTLDPRQDPTAPALPVPGAHADMLRLAELIRQQSSALSQITITLDSHHRVDIAHPPFWMQGDGRAVVPFTQITAEQVRQGQYRPRDDQALPRTLAYLDALEAHGRYTLMVWPIHCEIGTWGHNVHAGVQQACQAWEDERLIPVQYVNKGSNPWTEHYSALQAEVPDTGDPGTQLNLDLLARLDDSDLLLIAGQASSHCVKATTEHIADHLPGGRLGRIVLLRDGMSPVTGFESQADAFLTTMGRRGLQVATMADVPALLRDLRA